MWTNEQQHAIDVRDKNILVSAAAGSGKTAVLVERIITLIKQGEIRLDKLLITTFTVAAAGEIRERILKSLTEHLNRNPNDGEMAEQIALFDKATIGTIHSFCQAILRNNFYKTPLPADFKIADEAQLELLKEEVLSEVIEEEYEKADEAFLAFAEGYCPGKDDSSLRAIIKQLHNYSTATKDPIGWLEGCMDLYDLKDMTPDEYLFKGWGGEYIKSIAPMISAYISTYSHLIDEADAAEGYEAYSDFLRYEQDKLLDLYGKVAHPISWEQVSIAVQTFIFERMPSRAKGSDEAVKKLVSKSRDKLKRIFNEYKTEVFYDNAEQICHDVQTAGRFARALCQVVIKFSKEYSAAKLKKGWVDFSDLEHYTIQLLKEHKEDFKDSYDAIMIDEFQDTNEAQAEIFYSLGNGKNLFVVGDIKQSIYRFRNAQPQLFVRMDRQYNEEPEKGENIYLAKNFRSSKRVVDFANRVFCNVMNLWVGEVDYRERESLARGGNLLNNGHVEINIISKKFSNEDELNDNELMTNVLRREAILAAKKIYSLVEEEKPFIYDKSIDGMRRIEYRDITVLSRKSKGIISIFAEEIANLGMPVYCDETNGFENTTEITFLLSLMRIIDNPLQDIEMLAVLRSPVFGFNDDDLVSLRSIDRSSSIYHLLQQSEDIKAKDALSRIEGYIERAEFMTPGDILNMILEDTDYEAYVSAMPNSSVRLMNIQLLREKAQSFGTESFASLGEFLTYILTKTNLGMEDKTASAVSLNENTVRIMNVHKSKGLEFPVVFLVNTGSAFNKRDTSSDILYDVDMGLGLNVVDCDRRLKYGNISNQAIAQKKLIDGLSEEMRILYVALTRPISNLYIYGSVLDPLTAFEKWSNAPVENGKILPYIISTAASPLDWIMYGCTGDNDTPVNYYNAEDVFEGEMQEPEVIGFGNINGEVDKELLNLLDYKFGYSYPYEEATNLPSKLSVSEVLDNREHKAELIKADFAKETAGGLSGAQRGSIIHFILQSIDIHNTDSLMSVEEQIKHMTEKGQITPEAEQIADAKLIYRFFTSAEGMRMKAAKQINREYQFVAEFDAKELVQTNADEKILLQGVIDCWFEEGDEVVIYDFKTGNIDIHSQRYKAQLELYKTALERVLDKRVKETVICELD